MCTTVIDAMGWEGMGNSFDINDMYIYLYLYQPISLALAIRRCKYESVLHRDILKLGSLMIMPINCG